MAIRIRQSLARGEIDNRERGRVCGRLWLTGNDTPIVLELIGNAGADLAGGVVSFENPTPVVASDGPFELVSPQKGVAGEMTASRKVRVFDQPLEEGLETIRSGSKPPEHMANALYLEWFSQTNGRVVIESTDYRIAVSDPLWRLTRADEEAQSEATRVAMLTWLDQLEGARSDAPDAFEPEEEESAFDEFAFEKSMRESDERTDKYMELLKKYEDHPDQEQIVAREMGWEWLEEAVEAKERGMLPRAEEDEEELPPLEPNPATEGIDWIRDEDGDIRHPLSQRSLKSTLEITRYCRERKLTEDEGDADLHEMISQFQITSAKIAGALNGLAYRDDFTLHGGYVVAALKRALGYLNNSMSAAEKVAQREVLPTERIQAFRSEVFEIREEILRLMERFRNGGKV